MTQEGGQYYPGSVLQCWRVESVGEQRKKRPQHDGNRGAVQKRSFLQMRRVLRKRYEIKINGKLTEDVGARYS